ncbi:MAG: radical SAM protein [Aristaeellaceae bacterium]
MAEVVEVNSLAEVLADLERRGIPEAQRIYPINDYLSLKARLHNVPANGGFELTPFCNLDCKMCYVHLRPDQFEPGQRLLTVDEWKHIIDQAVDAGMISADLTGGECLTYPGFREVYLYLLSKGVRTCILTNGRLLTEEMVAFLSENPPSSIQVTIYGSSEEAYEKVCGHRAFQEVIDGIKRLKKAALRFQCTITPSRFMQEDADSLFELLRSMNVTYYLGGATLPARAETEREMDDYSVEMNAYMSMYAKEKEYRAVLEHDNNNIEAKEVPRYMPPSLLRLRGLQCSSGHACFHVNWKGEMCPCIAFSHTVHYSIPKGGFLETWKQIVKTMDTYREPIECRECKLRRECNSCPGEKAMCGLDGILNKAVCLRLKLDIERMQTDSKTIVDCNKDLK